MNKFQTEYYINNRIKENIKCYPEGIEMSNFSFIIKFREKRTKYGEGQSADQASYRRGETEFFTNNKGNRNRHQTSKNCNVFVLCEAEKNIAYSRYHNTDNYSSQYFL